MPGSEGSSKVLERDGDHMVAEFVTPVKTLTGKHSYRTVEEVALYPDDRITFRALEGLWSASSVPGSQAATQGFTFSCAGYDFLSAKNIDFQKLKKTHLHGSDSGLHGRLLHGHQDPNEMLRG